MRIVCFGDSLTSCGGPGGRYSDILEDRFPDHEILNRGAGGETFVDAKARLAEDVLAERPDIVLIEYGANDWWQDERPCTEWARDLEEIITRVKAIGARAVVVGVFGPYKDAEGRMVSKVYGIDERAVAYRKLEEALARKQGCEYIPNMQESIIDDRTCWRDRNHPNEHGNRYVADVLEPCLARLTGSTPTEVRRRKMRSTLDMWEEAVELGGDKPAAVRGVQRLTFAEADRAIGRLAAGLLAAAGKERPRVSVFLPNCLEYFLIYWAVVKAGGVIVPLNTWLRGDSLRSIFETVSPDVLVVSGSGDREALVCAASRPSLPVFGVAPDDSGAYRPFRWLLEQGGAPPRPEVSGNDMAIIMHTSGTTAAPKGAIMRHSDLVFNVMTTINAQDFTPDDVHLLVNPMFHCTALYSSLPAAAYQKTPLVITADTSPAGLLELIERERITTCLTVPSILQRVVSFPDAGAYDTSSLRVIGYAGSFMPVKTIRRLRTCFPECEPRNFFGLTETLSATHVLRGEEAEERPASIGRLLPFVEALIVDEEMKPLPAGEIGELLFARENVISGYFNRPGKLDEALVRVDGRVWFNTGDLALVDDEGYFFIKGRKKDMIIVGGENVFSAEVEAVLLGHEGIKEAAVKGIPATGVRESLGELIKAYIVLEAGVELGERDVRKHCHAVLPSYKIPHVIQFLEALPRNPSGKIVKGELS